MMEGFLSFSGIIIIIISFVCAVLAGNYFISTIIFSLGCIILGIAKIIGLLEDKK